MTTYNKSQIEWQCRRGMLELDKIIMPFFQQHFDTLTDEQKKQFLRLLDCTDLQLFSWLFKRGKAADEALQTTVDLILEKQHIIIK